VPGQLTALATLNHPLVRFVCLATFATASSVCAMAIPAARTASLAISRRSSVKEARRRRSSRAASGARSSASSAALPTSTSDIARRFGLSPATHSAKALGGVWRELQRAELNCASGNPGQMNEPTWTPWFEANKHGYGERLGAREAKPV
jgi:hypothetical protein